MRACCLLAALAGLTLCTPAARAGIVVNTAKSDAGNSTTTTDELLFAGDVSDSDLLHGIAGSGGAWNTSNGADPPNLYAGLLSTASPNWSFTVAVAPLRIMPMGDSITVGYTNADWTGGAFEFGYRSGLYTLLTDAGYHFQFVGASTEPWTYRDPLARFQAPARHSHTGHHHRDSHSHRHPLRQALPAGGGEGKVNQPEIAVQDLLWE